MPNVVNYLTKAFVVDFFVYNVNCLVEILHQLQVTCVVIYYNNQSGQRLVIISEYNNNDYNGKINHKDISIVVAMCLWALYRIGIDIAGHNGTVNKIVV